MLQKQQTGRNVLNRNSAKLCGHRQTANNTKREEKRTKWCVCIDPPVELFGWQEIGVFSTGL